MLSRLWSWWYGTPQAQPTQTGSALPASQRVPYSNIALSSSSSSPSMAGPGHHYARSILNAIEKIMTNPAVCQVPAGDTLKLLQDDLTDSAEKIQSRIERWEHYKEEILSKGEVARLYEEPQHQHNHQVQQNFFDEVWDVIIQAIEPGIDVLSKNPINGNQYLLNRTKQHHQKLEDRIAGLIIMLDAESEEEKKLVLEAQLCALVIHELRKTKQLLEGINNNLISREQAETIVKLVEVSLLRTVVFAVLHVPLPQFELGSEQQTRNYIGENNKPLIEPLHVLLTNTKGFENNVAKHIGLYSNTVSLPTELTPPDVLAAPEMSATPAVSALSLFANTANQFKAATDEMKLASKMQCQP